jgi:hypothetical protein
MIAITLEYRPLGFLWRRKLNKHMPARWSEMTARQMIAIPELTHGTIDDFKLLQIFIGIKKSIAKRLGGYQRFCLLQNLKYIKDLEPLSNFVINRIFGFHAPKNRLKDVSFGAFIFGDTYYQNYVSGKKEDLNKFIACFYYSRLGFKEKNIEINARLIGLSDILVREAVAVNYGLIREWLAKAYPYVFQKAEHSNKRSKGWVGVFDMLVKDDLANQDKWSKLPVSTVLRNLNLKIEDYLKNGGKV